MSANKKLLGIGLALTTFATMIAVVVSGGSMPQLKTDLFKADAVVDVSTAYSLLLNESWGYAGEATKAKKSSENNDFTIGFSNSGSDFSGAASGKAFATTTDGAYIYTVSLLNGISQVYVKGSSTNGKNGVTVYGHYYRQTECVDDSETVDGTLNSLIEFEHPTKYVAIKFEGTDDIESVEIGYSCSEASDPFDHMKSGGQNTLGNGLFQSMTGLSTTLPVGTNVHVTMDVSATGSFDVEACNIYWVDSVYTANGGEVNAKTSIKSIIANGDTGWHTIEFDATVRNFPALRLNNQQWNVVNTSEFGNAVYLIAITHASLDSFNYKNVDIQEVSTLISSKNKKNSYYQNITGLSTDLAVGTNVIVELDVLVTGSFDQWSSIVWVDAVDAGYGKSTSTSITSLFDFTNKTEWQHITFTATVRNFTYLRFYNDDSQYNSVNVSDFGNAVYIISQNNSEGLFKYKNVEIAGKLISSANTTGNGFYQNMTGLSTDLAVGTNVIVELDVLVTGSFNQWSSIHWIDTIYGDGSTRNENYSVSIASSFDFANKTEWQHVTFTATVRNFTNLRWGSAQYNPVDVSSFGNAVYIIAVNNSDGLFIYKNVEIKTPRMLVDIDNYNIVVSDSVYNDSSSPTFKAATILKNCLNEAGSSIDIVSDATQTTEFEIVLGETTRFSSGTFDAESYLIKTYNNKLHIDAENTRGIIYGVYAWLENVGFRFYSKNIKTIPDYEDIKVNDINLSSISSFNYREVVFSEDAFDLDWSIANGVNGTIGKDGIKDENYGGYFGYIGGNARVHNLIGNSSNTGWALIDQSYIENNPSWFSVDENGEPYVTDKNDYANAQICLSSEGALAKAKTYLIYKIQKEVVEDYDGQSTHFIVSPMDNDNWCHCDDCMAKYAQYGKSGAWINWVNELADHLKNCGESFANDITIETLAYGWTRDLPLGGVVPRDNVAIRYCSDFGGWVKDRNDSEILAQEKSNLEGWLDICNEVSVYYYAVHYSNCLQAYPNFDDIYYNIKYMYDVGVKGVYAEGYLDKNGEFGELRSYLISKMLQNPTMTYEQYNGLISSFCNAYYGAAGPYIVNYINSMKTALKGDIGVRGTINSSTINFTSGLREELESYWDAAESAVTGDALLRVKKSHLSWTYTMLSNYEGLDNYSSLCLQLAKDMWDLDVINVSHASVLSDPYDHPNNYIRNPNLWSLQPAN